MRSRPSARVRAGFGRAVLSNPNGATQGPRAGLRLRAESSLSAAPNRGGRSLGRRYVSSGIGSSQSGDLARAMGGGSDGRCKLSRIARAGSSSRISAMNFRRPPHGQAKASTSWTRFRSSAQSIRVDGSRRAAGATYLGATGAPQCGAGSLHRRARIGKVDGFTIRATAIAVVAAVAAVLSGEQLPFSSR